MKKSKRYLTDPEFSDLMREWDYWKNDLLGLNPVEITHGKHSWVWWSCKEYSHSWSTKLYSRTGNNPSGCGVCSGYWVLEGFNDLWTTDPDIASELLDTDLGYSLVRTSKEMVLWICSVGHIWESSVSNRSILGNGCPDCSERRVSILKNDYFTTHRERSKYLVNSVEGLTHSAGSDYKALWECENGHQWRSSFYNVSSGSWCDKCSNRVSGPEEVLSTIIKSGFQTQNYVKHLGKGFFPDFFLPEYNAYVEYDGSYYHKDVIEWDTWKTQALLDLGHKVIRIREQSSYKLDFIPLEHENLLQIKVHYRKGSLADVWEKCREWLQSFGTGPWGNDRSIFS